jgi:hypothetical protein
VRNPETGESPVPDDRAFVALLINGTNTYYHMAEQQYQYLLEWLAVGKERAFPVVAMEHPSDRKVVLTIRQGALDMITRGIE